MNDNKKVEVPPDHPMHHRFRGVHDPKRDRSVLRSFRKAFNSFKVTSPMLLGVILLVGIIQKSIPRYIITSVFSNNIFKDTLIGAVAGSISLGNPITSYIIGGELFKSGVSLYAVTAFMVAWVTIGLIQLPAEAQSLGKKFALLRNIFSFCLSVIIAIITVMIMR